MIGQKKTTDENDDEVPPNSPSNRYLLMANTHQRSRRGSTSLSRQASIAETANESMPISPAKVLVFKGKCSEVFKSTVEECVEDCILQFTDEASIYVPKANTDGSRSNSIRSQRRRSSTTLTPHLRPPGMSTAPLPSIVMTTNRIRQQLFSGKHTLTEDISEETTDPTVDSTVDLDLDHPEESVPAPSNYDTCSQSSRPKAKTKSATPLSYRDRQKVYRLSDLVMLGPEPFAHVFNLARSTRKTARNPQSRQRSTSEAPSFSRASTKTEERYEQFDPIKQDLFHRYLWTQKPQVSIRIRPLSTYARPSTFAM